MTIPLIVIFFFTWVVSGMLVAMGGDHKEREIVEKLSWLNQTFFNK